MMRNVTDDARGFRLGPHNLQFKKPIRISIPYVRSRVSHGDDVGVFYYDDQSLDWARVAMAGRPGRGMLAAETTHFTDFIAATISQPDHPEVASFSTNTRSDLKIGDPLTGMTLIKPPSPSNDGAAHLAYHIDIPPGRQGMEPNLNLVYNSDKGNGLLGVGWDLSFSKIEVDTRFGVPRYDFSTESERYLLDGEELVPVLQGSESANGPLSRLNAREFRHRSEGKFLRISRINLGGDPRFNSYWVTQDRSGTVTFYGVPFDGTKYLWIDAAGGTALWGINSSHDTFGNAVFYEGSANFAGLPVKQLVYTAVQYTYLLPESCLDQPRCVPGCRTQATVSRVTESASTTVPVPMCRAVRAQG